MQSEEGHPRRKNVWLLSPVYTAQMNAFEIDLENGRSEVHNQEEIELPEVPSTALGDLLPGDKGTAQTEAFLLFDFFSA